MTILRLPDGIARVADTLRGRRALVEQVGWVGGGFAVQQGLRLVTNVALAWLLAPALLGTMILINTLRVGGELLSDVGIGQSLVHNPRAAEQGFFDTAWTMKVIRGFALCAVMCLATYPLMVFYDEPDLAFLLPISGFIFILSGFALPSKSLLLKEQKIKRIVVFEVGLGVFSLFVHIGLALITPTIWALMGGLVLGTLASAIASFYLIPGKPFHLRIERAAFSEILDYGKWIFFGSLIFFLAMNFDRLYFAQAIPFAVLGIYGIARTYSETIMQIFQKLGAMLVFPKVAGASARGADLRALIGPTRWLVLLGAAAGLAVAVTFADIFITLVYDDRYLPAGIFLTILLFGTWFAILGALADAIVMGVGKPASVATSNFAKLIVIVIGLPLLLPQFGIIAALIVFVFAEALRYAVLVLRKRTMGLGFTRQDIMATILFVFLAFAMREISGLAGLTTGIPGWIEAARVAHV